MPSSEKIAKYKKLLADLLPPGRLWDILNQPTLSALIGSLAPEFARVDDRVADLLREADPRQCDETLEDWERVLGLPDSCTAADATVEERRQAVVQKYTEVGGISGNYYEFLINQLGYPAVVTKWREFQVGRSVVGDPLTNDFDMPFTVGMTVGHTLHDVGWLFYWNVKTDLAEDVHFEVGRSTVGERLRAYGNHLVECKIRKLKPAHAGVTFNFNE